MGYKILYDFLKRNKKIYIYDAKWEDYLPSDIEKVMNIKNNNENYKIYYSKKLDEYYKVDWDEDIATKAKHGIEMITEDAIKNLIFEKKLYHYLLDGFKTKFGFDERI